MKKSIVSLVSSEDGEKRKITVKFDFEGGRFYDAFVVMKNYRSVCSGVGYGFFVTSMSGHFCTFESFWFDNDLVMRMLEDGFE